MRTFEVGIPLGYYLPFHSRLHIQHPDFQQLVQFQKKFNIVNYSVFTCNINFIVPNTDCISP